MRAKVRPCIGKGLQLTTHHKGKRNFCTFKEVGCSELKQGLLWVPEQGLLHYGVIKFQNVLGSAGFTSLGNQAGCIGEVTELTMAEGRIDEWVLYLCSRGGSLAGVICLHPSPLSNWHLVRS